MCKIRTCRPPRRGASGERGDGHRERSGWGWRLTQGKVEVSGAQGLVGGETEGDVE